MTDTEPDSDEISEEVDKLLREMITDGLSESENQSVSQPRSREAKESSTNSTAERILDILLADARMSISEIADRADVSKPTVRKYIDQLESKDIIVGYSVEIDPGKLRNQTISLVRIEIDETAIEEATSALAAMEPVRSLFSLKEETGAIAEVRADGFMQLGAVVSDDILAINGVEAAHTSILEERS